MIFSSFFLSESKRKRILEQSPCPSGSHSETQVKTLAKFLQGREIVLIRASLDHNMRKESCLMSLPLHPYVIGYGTACLFLYEISYCLLPLEITST